MNRDLATILTLSELTKLQPLITEEAMYKGGYTYKLEFRPPQFREHHLKDVIDPGK